MTLTSSPAIIIRSLLIANNLGSDKDADSVEAWPIHIQHEPDGDEEQDNMITLYDLGGTDDGRAMRTGERFDHETLQVRVRAKDFLIGRARMKLIADLFDGILREPVTVVVNETTSEDYAIQNISRSSPILPLGQEKGTKRRQLFTLNVAVTINEEN